MPACQKSWTGCLWGILGFLIVTAPLPLVQITPAFAQEEKKEGSSGFRRGSGFLINPEQMLENAVRDAAVRYGLDADQRDLARQIFAEHGKRFFDKHFDEIRALQIEGMKLRFAGEEDPETIKELAKRFKLVFDDARQMLEEAGDDFHKILDQEQAAQHNKDRASLREGLDKAAKMLDQSLSDGITPWARERLASGEALEAQRRRMRWTGGGIVERDWEAYTEAFIVHYRLHDEQASRARQMLDLARKDAIDYRKANEKTIRDIVEAYRKIGEEERDPGTTATRKAELRDLRKPLDADAAKYEKPLDQMFRDLREALDTIPTDEQKRKAGPFGPRTRSPK